MTKTAAYQSAIRLGSLAAVALFVSALQGHADADVADTDAPQPMCRGKAATIVGTAGNDDIVGTPKTDVIVGGRGTDNISGGAGNDIICGGRSGIRVEEGENVTQSLSGGPGKDVLVGGPNRDAVYDRDGVDLLLGRGGGDYLSTDDRGPGSDDDVLRGGPGTDQLSGGGGADRLLGGKGNDLFQDPLGDNVIRGGGGIDRIESGRGNDTMYGGLGGDAATYIAVRGLNYGSTHCNGITADLSTGVAFGAGFGVDALAGVENLATGGGHDALVGDSANNTFYVGYPLGECYEDGALREAVAGGGGWDRISFDSTYWEGGSPFGPVVVDLSAGTAEQWSLIPEFEPNPVARVALASVENVTGTDHADIIAGDYGPNRLSGGGPGYSNGGDVLRGRAGDDDLFGSGGRDTIYGDEGDDTLSGYEGNDSLDGGTGTNTIDGGRGRDTCHYPGRFNGALNCEA